MCKCAVDSHTNSRKWKPLGPPLLKHWAKKQVFYDDGSRMNTPSDLPGIIHMLRQAIGSSSEAEWDKSLPVKRFGMPKQPLVADGCGSCGVGVILAVYDFLNTSDSQIPDFQWQFTDIARH